MHNARLSEHLRRYYEEKQPSEKQMDRLLAMANSPSSRKTTSNSYFTNSASRFKWLRRGSQGPMRPAYLISLLALSFIFSTLMVLNTNFGDVSQRVAQEISLNHNKQLMLEFPADSYLALRKQMSKLDFILRPSTRITSSQYQLLGGRYCSIQGHLAAQLKLEDDRGDIHTLYQTLRTGELTKLTDGSLQMNGLNISLWYEAGLLYGMASPVTTP